jgi:hypothetical protein
MHAHVFWVQSSLSYTTTEPLENGQFQHPRFARASTTTGALDGADASDAGAVRSD